MDSTCFLLELRGRAQRTTICAVTFCLFALTAARGQQPPDACKLLQPAELESALGGKVGKLANVGSDLASAGFNTQNSPNVCSGQVGSLKVMIRTAKREGDGTKERKGLEIARSQGWQIEVKSEGELTCSSAMPPPSQVQYGFNTTCSILRAGRVVAVEVTAPSQKEMVSMDAVRKLVQKAASRL
jgi:hypothetical protein